MGYVQDERYIAGEHMDVRRDCVSFARRIFFSWDQTVRNELRTLRRAGRNHKKGLDTFFIVCIRPFPFVIHGLNLLTNLPAKACISDY